MPTPTTPDHQPIPQDATAGGQRAATEARRAAARAFAARTRAAQGLPRHVQDPEVIAELVMLFRPRRATASQPSTTTATATCRGRLIGRQLPRQATTCRGLGLLVQASGPVGGLLAGPTPERSRPCSPCDPQTGAG